MVVYVGATDPNYRLKQLDRIGSSIANAISYVNEAKEKKRAAVRQEFEDALALGKEDPEAGKLAMDSMRERYSEKLLEKSVPELDPYAAMMEKKQAETGESAWSSFSNNLIDAQNKIEEKAAALEKLPKTVALDPSSVSPEEYAQRMVAFTQGDMSAFEMANPEYAKAQAELQQWSDPTKLFDVARGRLSAKDRLLLQKYMDDREMSPEKVFGIVDQTRLSQKQRGLIATGATDEERKQAAQVEAGLALSPAELAAQEFDMTMQGRRHEDRLKETEARGEQQRLTEGKRQEGARTSAQERMALERLRQQGKADSATEGGTVSVGEDGDWVGAALNARKKRFTRRKISISPEVEQRLADGVQEQAFMANLGGDNDAKADMLTYALDEYEKAYKRIARSAPNLKDDEIARRASAMVFDWPEEEQAAGGDSVTKYLNED